MTCWKWGLWCFSFSCSSIKISYRYVIEQTINQQAKSKYWLQQTYDCISSLVSYQTHKSWVFECQSWTSRHEQVRVFWSQRRKITKICTRKCGCCSECALFSEQIHTSVWCWRKGIFNLFILWDDSCRKYCVLSLDHKGGEQFNEFVLKRLVEKEISIHKPIKIKRHIWRRFDSQST